MMEAFGVGPLSSSQSLRIDIILTIKEREELAHLLICGEVFQAERNF